MRRNRIYTLTLILLFSACQKSVTTKPLWEGHPSIPASKEVSVLVTGLNSTQKKELENQAKLNGIKHEGSAVITLSGLAGKIKKISLPWGTGKKGFPSVLLDETLVIKEPDVPRKSGESGKNSSHSHPSPTAPRRFFAAKEEFGVPKLLQGNPTYDGRGVIVGIIDDGVSPLANGMRTTSDGKRKFIAKNTVSTLLQFKLERSNPLRSSPLEKPPFFEDETAGVWTGVIDENKLEPIDNPIRKIDADVDITDLNEDGEKTEISVLVYKQSGLYRICLDTNLNGHWDYSECFGTFNETGEFGYWNLEKPVSVTGEFNPETQTLTLNQGERAGDDHGEGVASVILGYQIAGQFDGVAPGAQLIDCDIDETFKREDRAHYSIGRFLRALDWLGEKGAEVVNISYSLFFTSAKAQVFMRKALKEVIDRHNLVTVWSAGNFGPGLGTLNRTGIYPDNVLIAGAYVSPDLDEAVHGVTGLPEEGRVVWYSSRGPGSHWGRGPTVISPLASLAHAEPQSGFQAFSGTSSAAPALAGLAAVLISAVKQRGLEVDASSVVHALRLSGKPLSDVPFVEQGYGLPQIDLALELYETLLEGKSFAYVRSTWGNQTGPDGVKAYGFFFERSDFDRTRAGTREYRVRLQGHLANGVPTERKADLLQGIKLEYSHDWLDGPGVAWLGSGPSHFSLLVDTIAARRELLEDGNRGDTLYGEIRLIDPNSELHLHTIPVTIVDDVSLDRVLGWTIELDAEEGKQKSFRVPFGTPGYLVKSELIEGSSNDIYIDSYDPSHRRTEIYTTAGGKDLFVPTPRYGNHQLGFGRSKGTDFTARFGVEIHPIKLKLKSEGVSRENPTIRISNSGPIFEGTLVLRPKAEELETKIVELGEDNLQAEVVVAVDGPGVYSIHIAEVHKSDLYYEQHSCVISVSDKTEKVVKRVYDFSIKINEENADEESEKSWSKLRFVCRPFEHTSDTSYKVTWKLTTKKAPLERRNWIEAPFRAGGHTSVEGALKWNAAISDELEVGTTLEVGVQPGYNGKGYIKLGEIDVY